MMNLSTWFHDIDCEHGGVEFFMRAFQERRKVHVEFSLNDGIILTNILMVYMKMNRAAEAAPGMKHSYAISKTMTMWY